ncbi:MAG: sigma-54-dependent Fis family transcriptional regulator [Firmicutes bacterium]|nr:sigma-54-dependent Fis family transcriptional regulator [Bacillota bacterium]
MSLDSLRKYLERVKQEWEKFTAGEEIARGIVPHVIKRSWIRSRAYGVDPLASEHDSLETEIKWAAESNPLLQLNVSFTNPFESAGYQIQLYDAAGYPLINSKANAALVEKRIGTNSVWLALTQNRLITVLGCEHYCARYHNIYAAAAPIHGHAGQILGVINVVCNELSLAPNVASMAAQCAGVVEISLSLLNHTGKQSPLEAFFYQFPQGIAWYNENKLIRYNQKILEMLEITEEEDIQAALEKQLSLWLSGRLVNRKPVSITISGQKKEFFFTSMPIAAGPGRGKERFLLLEEKDSKGKQQLVTDGTTLAEFDNIIGESKQIKETKRIAQKIAGADEPILIIGESGTGKELFAQAIHKASMRSGKFVAVNCGAIPAELAESELFGYEHGAFTGALKRGKEGLLETASGGTLFLDEIESMPLFIQVKLLRALATGCIMRVGSTEEIPINVRVISATKKDLLQEAKAGNFREDLYYRLSTFILELPPLRERGHDIIVLAQHFIKKNQVKYGKYPLKITRDFWRALTCYEWRGNVRELENVMSRVVFLAEQQTLTAEVLPAPIQEALKLQPLQAALAEDEAAEQTEGLLQTSEEQIIAAVLQKTNFNITKASQMLGISRKTLYNRINSSERLSSLRSLYAKG